MTTALTAEDVAAIRSTVPVWIQLALDRNWDTLLTMCDGAIAFLPPGSPIVRGPDAVLEFLDSYPEILDLDLVFEEIDGRGDFATGRGALAMTVDVDGRHVLMKGKFIDTFRRQPDGTWLYHEFMWNLDAPADR